MKSRNCLCGHSEDRHVNPNIRGEICIDKDCACKEFRPTKRAVDLKPRKPRKVKSRKASNH